MKQLFSSGLHHFSTVVFIFGFVFDFIFLPGAGHLLSVYLVLIYLSIVAISLYVREWVITWNRASRGEMQMYALTTFSIAYFSGSALSFVLVYTLRSVELSVSWPLLLILLFCILVNEMVSTHNFRLTLDVAVLFIAFLFFSLFNMPLIFKQENDFVFTVSIIVAIAISVLFVFFFQKSSETAREESSRLFALAVGIPMFVGMLYFLNILPAVPLEMTDHGVYRAIIKLPDGSYSLNGDTDTRWLARFRRPIVHLRSGETTLYFYSAVSAPADLTAPLSHVWEYWNPATHAWETKLVQPFNIVGGRGDGYRAYSLSQTITPGLWRVTVKVDANRVVGRETFVVTGR